MALLKPHVRTVRHCNAPRGVAVVALAALCCGLVPLVVCAVADHEWQCRSLEAADVASPSSSLCGMLLATDAPLVFAPPGNVSAWFAAKQAVAAKEFDGTPGVEYDAAACWEAVRYTVCAAEFQLCNGTVPTAGVCLSQCYTLAACGYNVSDCSERGGNLRHNCSTLLPPAHVPPADEPTCYTPASGELDYCTMLSDYPLVSAGCGPWPCRAGDTCATHWRDTIAGCRSTRAGGVPCLPGRAQRRRAGHRGSPARAA